MVETPNEDESHPGANDADPGRLAALLAVNLDTGVVRWRPTDFAALWRHQLAAPLRAELGSEERDAPAPPAGMTVGDLLHHPCPRPDLLERLRNFAKSSTSEPGVALPSDVARVLYFASIAAGLNGGGPRQTSLDDDSLRRGLAWAAAQEWVDVRTRELLSLGLDRPVAGESDDNT